MEVPAPILHLLHDCGPSREAVKQALCSAVRDL